MCVLCGGCLTVTLNQLSAKIVDCLIPTNPQSPRDVGRLRGLLTVVISVGKGREPLTTVRYQWYRIYQSSRTQHDPRTEPRRVR
jgi:hypothetical protein